MAEKNSITTTQKNITANQVSGGTMNVFSVTAPNANIGLQKMIAACLAEIEGGQIDEAFIRELANFSRRSSMRDLKKKLGDAGKNEAYYDFAIEAKESFAKFFEVIARHPSGQKILVSAFSHAYSVFREKINPEIDNMTFKTQEAIFEEDVVLYLSHNLIGMPGFHSRNEALGLLFFLADNCFIEYAHV